MSNYKTLTQASHVALACTLLSISMLSSCGHSTSNSGSASDNPQTLLGSWKAPGPVPKVNHELNQHWITMNFSTDGRAHIEYQDGMPLYSGNMSSDSILRGMVPKNEIIPYEDLGAGKLRITYGSQAYTYTYEITANKLYLTPPTDWGAPTSIYIR